MDGVGISIDVPVCLFSLEAILQGLRALSQGHGVYFHLVLAVLLTALDVRINLLYKEELQHFPVDVCS